MKNVKGLYIMPHPPIIMPKIGRGEEKKAQSTIDALMECSKEIAKLAPSTIVLITPHGPMFEDTIVIMMDNILSGDMGRFGRPRLKYKFENDIDLGIEIMQSARNMDIPCIGLDVKSAKTYGVSTDLDWGALVPLHFVLENYREFKLVHITVSFLEYSQIHRFGTSIAEAIENLGTDTVIISSADLSHRLAEDGPYGFNPAGPKLDKAITDNIKEGSVKGLMNLDRGLIRDGGECGLRPIIMGFGALYGQDINPRLLSYEGPFGVGYSVASILPKANGEGPYVSLARRALETYINTGEIIEPTEDLPRQMIENRAGVFVTLNIHGNLRGCIGTIGPTKENIAKELIDNAISAGTEDPRFTPVRRGELSDIVYSVDVLENPEPIDSIEDLNVKKYGVIVKKGLKRGLLLPNIEGIDSPEEQVSIALQKAGIRPNERYKMERFKVIRYK
ncbi:MAG: AmmeMemoRadiSam system protein A [Clostridiales bacterium]|nr:AmmeMemoRadiSam system protein A [Clostridiales bacterium]